MKKGQRPGKHTRLVKTKRGEKPIVVNPGIAPVEKNPKSRNKAAKQMITSIINQSVENEPTDYPTIRIGVSGTKNKYQVRMQLNWQGETPLFVAEFRAKNIKEFDEKMAEHLKQMNYLTGGMNYFTFVSMISPPKKGTLSNTMLHQLRTWDSYIKGGGQVLQRVLWPGLLATTAQIHLPSALWPALVKGDAFGALQFPVAYNPLKDEYSDLFNLKPKFKTKHLGTAPIKMLPIKPQSIRQLMTRKSQPLKPSRAAKRLPRRQQDLSLPPPSRLSLSQTRRKALPGGKK